MTPDAWQQSQSLQLAFPCSQPSSEFKFHVKPGLAEPDGSPRSMPVPAHVFVQGDIRGENENSESDRVLDSNPTTVDAFHRDSFPIRRASQRTWKELRDQKRTMAVRVSSGPLTLMLMTSQP